MPRIYFDDWFEGCHVRAMDWYCDNLVYVNVQVYTRSTAVSRPDEDKGFLLRLDSGSADRITHYKASIAHWLISREESRDEKGLLLPLTLSLPEVDLFATRAATQEGETPCASLTGN